MFAVVSEDIAGQTIELFEAESQAVMFMERIKTQHSAKPAKIIN